MGKIDGLADLPRLSKAVVHEILADLSCSQLGLDQNYVVSGRCQLSQNGFW